MTDYFRMKDSSNNNSENRTKSKLILKSSMRFVEERSWEGNFMCGQAD